MFEKGKIFIAPSLNVSEYIVEEREDELEAKILELQENDPTLEICTPEDFDPAFLPGLKKDLEVLYMDDLIEMSAVQQLKRFDGHKFKSAKKAFQKDADKIYP